MNEGALVDHFNAAIVRLLPGFADNDDILGLAVSGGPDSLALLLLAHEAFPERIAAATVDHQLRKEARDEALFVANLCVERGISHSILTPRIPIRGSIQAEARKARYSLLHGWMEHANVAWLATAHHADDQLETLVMRILRGSGLDGMSAIRARRGHIIRPLLDITKNQLVEFVQSHDIEAVDDASNQDQGFDRVRVRNALAGLEGFDVSLANHSAAALEDSRVALNWMVDGLAADHLSKTETGCILAKTDFPHEIQRRLVLKSIHICDPALSPRGEQLERTIAALVAHQTTTIGNILCQGGAQWTFSPAPRRQNS